MTTYYRKTWDIIGYTFHADIYCEPCGDTFPDTDPEGNAKHPVFADAELDEDTYCGKCGEHWQGW